MLLLTPAMDSLNPLARCFYDRATEVVARELLGCRLVHREGGTQRIGRIVETEAYLGTTDLACHAAKGRTARTETMFGPPGHAYVYFIYGMHHCLNAVTREVGFAEAVLLRAVEPLADCEGRTDGPGKLCRAMGINRRFDGIDLCGEVLFIAPPERLPASIARAPRVGVDYAGRWARRLLRFYERGNPFVSPAGRKRRDAFRPNARVL